MECQRIFYLLGILAELLARLAQQAHSSLSVVFFLSIDRFFTVNRERVLFEVRRQMTRALSSSCCQRERTAFTICEETSSMEWVVVSRTQILCLRNICIA